jgi:putative transposase
MPRGPRLDAEGAVHHVMARGIERRDIFLDDEDRSDMLERLGSLVPRLGCEVYAWSLLSNHFHLLIRSGKAGLSALMRRLQTGYAIAFNRRHRRSGHLFHNRFKSILVEEEPYLLELVRYIHLNPLRAGLVRGMRGLDAYPWSGHGVLLGRREAAFQETQLVLSQFGRGLAAARRAYRAFVQEGVPQGRRPELAGGGLVRSIGGRGQIVALRRGRERWASDERVLGSSEFVLGLQAAEEQRREGRKAGRPQAPVDPRGVLDRLAAAVAGAFEVSEAELRSGSRRPPVVEARAALAFLGRVHLGLPTRLVTEVAGVSGASVMRLLGRGERALGEHRLQLSAIVDKCEL